MIWLRGMAKSRKLLATQSAPITIFSLPRTVAFQRLKPATTWNLPLLNWSRNLHLRTVVKMRRYAHIPPLGSFHPFHLKDHTDNFGHPAIRELLHVFLYGCDNWIGNLRPEEFGRRIPNGTLSLATTAVSPKYKCIACWCVRSPGPMHPWRLQDVW